MPTAQHKAERMCVCVCVCVCVLGGGLRGTWVCEHMRRCPCTGMCAQVLGWVWGRAHANDWGCLLIHCTFVLSAAVFKKIFGCAAAHPDGLQRLKATCTQPLPACARLSDTPPPLLFVCLCALCPQHTRTVRGRTGGRQRDRGAAAQPGAGVLQHHQAARA